MKIARCVSSSNAPIDHDPGSFDELVEPQRSKGNLDASRIITKRTAGLRCNRVLELPPTRRVGE